MSSPSDNERPSKKARPTETNKENKDNDQRESNKVCRFRITNIECNENYGMDCHISLVSKNHGLYHLIDIVFHHQLHELSGGDCIYSHLWKVKFDGREYDSNVLLPEFGSTVCDAENPRLLYTFNPKRVKRVRFVASQESSSLWSRI